MNVPTTIEAAAWLGKYLEGADGDQDLARAMITAFTEALMSTQASMQWNVAYGERTDERENGCLGLERLGAHRWQEAGEVLTVSALHLPCPEGEGGVLILTPALPVLALDDPRFVRVKPEAHLSHPPGNGSEHLLGLLG